MEQQDINTQEEQEVQVSLPEQPEEEPLGGYVSPRGAFAFVMLMLVFYIGYWFISWIEIFVIRGA